MKRMYRRLALILAGVMMLTPFANSGVIVAAGKPKIKSVKVTNAGKKLRMQKGGKYTLQTTIQVSPNTKKNVKKAKKSLKFTSSNRKVVMINSKGKMKAKKVGTSKITVSSKLNSKKKSTISVSVTNDVLVKSIQLDKTKITAEEYQQDGVQLKVKKILPVKAKNKRVKWSTSNEDVADVDSDGNVSFAEAGTATIIATAADKGGAKAECKVTVNEASDEKDGEKGSNSDQSNVTPVPTEVPEDDSNTPTEPVTTEPSVSEPTPPVKQTMPPTPTMPPSTSMPTVPPSTSMPTVPSMPTPGVSSMPDAPWEPTEAPTPTPVPGDSWEPTVTPMPTVAPMPTVPSMPDDPARPTATPPFAEPTPAPSWIPTQMPTPGVSDDPWEPDDSPGPTATPPLDMPTPVVSDAPWEPTETPMPTPTWMPTTPDPMPTPSVSDDPARPAPTPTPIPNEELNLSKTVALNGKVTVGEDGSVSSTGCDGLVIPLGTEFSTGARVRFTVYGEASQGIRGWLEAGTADNNKASEELNPVEFGKEFILTATGDAAGNKAKYLEIKKPAWNSPAFTSITITKVEFAILPEARWVTTWGTAEERDNLGDNSAMPKMPLKDTTIREIIKVTTSGKKIRFRLSNQYGESDVTVKSMHIAKQVDATKSTIDTSTDTIITVDQKEEFVIPKGQVIMTDAADFDVAALENIAISMYFGETPTINITGHRGARATTYQVSGNNVSAETFNSPQTTTSWFFLADCSLWAEEGGKAVVCFGDSITDGYGTDASYLGKKPDSYTRWGDYFAKRLQANEWTKNVAVINEGIGSNSILGSYPTDSGRDRFARDLLQHDGVEYCIILFGVNDLDKLKDTSKYNQLLPEYQKMVKLCHDNGIKVYGAPILPFGTSSYYSDSSEEVRQMINNWMRSTESEMDGIIDFEGAVADPANPKNILKEYTHDDGLHPYDGYEVMADAINLGLFY